MARWNIEATYDYVEFKTSLNGGTTYIPMKGRYTKNGSGNQDPGKPLYDGKDNAWFPEEVMLENTQNKQMTPKFTLVSDAGTTYDGFYFDDFKVTIIDMTYSGTGDDLEGNDNYVSEAFPNPAGDHITIRYNVKDINPVFDLYSGSGSLIREEQLFGARGEYRFSVTGMAEGIYFYRIRSNSGPTGMKKLIVIR